jgi:hypothetical protein
MNLIFSDVPFLTVDTDLTENNVAHIKGLCRRHSPLFWKNGSLGAFWRASVPVMVMLCVICFIFSALCLGSWLESFNYLSECTTVPAAYFCG